MANCKEQSHLHSSCPYSSRQSVPRKWPTGLLDMHATCCRTYPSQRAISFRRNAMQGQQVASAPGVVWGDVWLWEYACMGWEGALPWHAYCASWFIKPNPLPLFTVCKLSVSCHRYRRTRANRCISLPFAYEADATLPLYIEVWVTQFIFVSMLKKSNFHSFK